MKKEFEIEPGIIISKLNIKPTDQILVTVDLDKYDLDTAYNLFCVMEKEFPTNQIVMTFKGIEISAGATPSPK